MEVTVKNVTCGAFHNITFSLETKRLVGILTDHLEILDLFCGNNITKGEIHYKGVPDHLEDPEMWKRQVEVLKLSEAIPNLATVEEVIRWYFYQNNIPLNHLTESITTSFQVMEVSQTILSRKWNTLSSSEQFWVRLALAYVKDPNVLILEEPFSLLDEKGQQKLKVKLNKLLEKPGKMVFVGSRNPDIIAKTCENTILFFHNTCVKAGKTRELFTEDVESLLEKKVSLPKTISFVHKVKKEKKIKLMYQIDILDVIKDVYKHVPNK